MANPNTRRQDENSQTARRQGGDEDLGRINGDFVNELKMKDGPEKRRFIREEMTPEELRELEFQLRSVLVDIETQIRREERDEEEANGLSAAKRAKRRMEIDIDYVQEIRRERTCRETVQPRLREDSK